VSPWAILGKRITSPGALEDGPHAAGSTTPRLSTAPAGTVRTSKAALDSPDEPRLGRRDPIHARGPSFGTLPLRFCRWGWTSVVAPLATEVRVQGPSGANSTDTDLEQRPMRPHHCRHVRGATARASHDAVIRISDWHTIRRSKAPPPTMSRERPLTCSGSIALHGASGNTTNAYCLMRAPLALETLPYRFGRPITPYPSSSPQ